MNYSLIFAGGTGQRMNSKSLPKQFLSVHGKPIIMHTILCFENCDEIDGIIVVCYMPFINKLKSLLTEYNIKKVIDITSGGESGQQSIFRGLERLSKTATDRDIVLIHDGVRPIITDELIKNNIECVKEHGNAISASKAIETVVVSVDGKVKSVADRSQCYYAKAPQSFKFGEIYDCHKRAASNGHSSDFIDSATMMRYYGYELNIIECSSENIKITTPTDFFMFKAILDARENEQIKIF